jgi:hypothetical protein
MKILKPVFLFGLTVWLFVAFALLGSARGADCGFRNRRSITIDGDQVGGSSGYLDDFPVLVNLSGDWLKTAPEGDIQDSSGWDILFRGVDSTTCDGTAPCDLDFEIEKYDGSAGELVAWVRVPQVYAGDNDEDNDTVIYMYYGNGCIDEDPQNATGVWNSNYEGVWHLAEKYGLDFNGSTSYVDTNYSTHHTETTIEAWIYLYSWGEGTAGIKMGRIIDKNVSGTQSFHLYLYDDVADATPDENLRFERDFDGGGGSAAAWRTPDNSLTLNKWYHIAVTYDDSDPSNTPSIYINGEAQTLSVLSTATGTAITNTDHYLIGNRGAQDRTFDGIIDDLRMYSRILTSDEINDDYLGKRESSRDGLLIEYLMDDGSGNTVSDSSGNGHDGDMTGHAADWVRPRAHDSTDNSNSGKRSESMAAPEERINGCDPFNINSIGIPDPGGSWEFADGGLDAGKSDFTISTWFLRSSSMTENWPTIVYKGAGGSTAGYWFDYVKDHDAINLNIDDGPSTRFVANSDDDIGVTADEWHYVTVVLDRDLALDTAYFYLDGEPVGSESSDLVADKSISSDEDVWFGSNSFIGNLDEVRIASTTRSAAWIETEFNNQKEGSTFLTLGDPDCGFGFRRSIKIDGDEVGGSSGYLDDFPVLVSLSGDWLKTAPEGEIQHSSGWDIIFRGLDDTTCDGTSPCDLPFEIEKYDGSTGELVAWVKVPKLYAGDGAPNTDTVIYMYYGNGCIDEDPQDATGVWDSNYKGVWHLAEKYGLDFTDAGDYVDTNYSTHHSQTTIEAWIYPEAWGIGTNMGRVVEKRTSGDQVLVLYLDGNTSNNYLLFERMFDDGGDINGVWHTDHDTIVLNTWQHVAVTYDESDPAHDPSIYINGELQNLTQTDIPSGTAKTNADDYIIGNRGNGGRTFDGMIDNVRVYSRILTSDEINDDYLGKREPSRDGLVLEYLMDDGSGNTVSDTSGSGYDGDMTGHAADWVRPRVHDSTDNSHVAHREGSMAAPAERINGCDPFDGSDDIVVITDPGGAWEFGDGGLDAGTSNFTISAWVLWDAAFSESFPTIFKKGGGSSENYGYWFNYQKSPDELDLRLSNGSSRPILNSDTSIGLADGEWHHVAVILTRGAEDDRAEFFFDGETVGGESTTLIKGTSITGTEDVAIGANTSGEFRPWKGSLDEVRIASTARTAAWIETEFNNQKEGSTFFALGDGEPDPPLVVELGGFRARGVGGGVLIEWETKSEVDNLGFNLYRSTEREGRYVKLNAQLIPGLISSVSGRGYTYTDTGVRRGALYYYKLEDIDLDGSRTVHGPVCVDWDGDGVADEGGADLAGGGSGGVSVGLGSGDGTRVSGSGGLSEAGGGGSGTAGASGPRARQIDSGVLLEWRGKLGTGNLGYYVYRDKNGRLRKLTPELVPGSVFSARLGAPGEGEKTYYWWDNNPRGRDASRYWVEDVGIDGEGSMIGPITPETSYWSMLSEVEQAILRSKAYEQARQGAARARARVLREGFEKGALKGSSGAFRVTPAPAEDGKPDERVPSSQQVQWTLASGQAVKLWVRESGWYRVGQPELMAAGLDPDVDPRYLKLYMNGKEQAIEVRGERDGRFDPGDAVEFYGVGLKSPLTETRVYWLVEGSSYGERIEKVKGPGRGEREVSFPCTVQREDKQIYLAAVRNGDEDNFFGAIVWTTPVEQVLDVPGVDPATTGDATLRVVLQGVTEAAHRVKVKLDGVEVGEVIYEGQGKGRLDVSVPQSMLLTGEDLVTLEAQGGTMDMSVVDAIKLRYWRMYDAGGDALECTAEGGSELSISGFGDAGVSVVDVSKARDVVRLEGRVRSQGSGYAVTVEVPGSGTRSLFAFCEGGVKEVAGMEINLPSWWHEAGQGADLVIITHGGFMESLEPLVALRESQGFSVVLVDVADVYDEFNFGHKGPQALKDFIAHARGIWDVPPRYVLLVGDASFDPCNHLGMGEYDFVPTKVVDTDFLETASDDWFGDLDGDGLAEVAVGRLPVRSVQEAALMVGKIIDYERVDQERDVVVVADEYDGSFDFEGACLDVEGLIPEGFGVFEIFRGHSPTARRDLLERLGQGALLVNYMGHGSCEIWNGGLFSSADALVLTNGWKLPFFVNMTCLNGLFHDLYTQCLAEGLMKAKQGGAVAVWASSGLCQPTGQAVMNQELVRLLFGEGPVTLGETAMWAKEATDDADVRKTWILFGDPTTRLR